MNGHLCEFLELGFLVVWHNDVKIFTNALYYKYTCIEGKICDLLNVLAHHHVGIKTRTLGIF
jgi:hypothetical protein